MKRKPNYTKDTVYLQMSKLIEDAGITIDYRDRNDEDFDYPINGSLIIMPSTDDLPSINAAIELGNKAGAILAENTSSRDLGKAMLMESEARKIGIYLYRLAKMMVTHKNNEKRKKEVLNKLKSI